jgi:hypothetical protein
MHLVYVQTTVGVQAQKVPELVPNTHNGVPRYLATHTLPAHQSAWSIDALKVMYPAPEERAES